MVTIGPIQTIIAIVISVIIGAVIGFCYRKQIAEAKIGVAEKRATDIVEDAKKEAEAKKMTKKQFGVIVLYSVILTIVLWLLFTQILKCVLP